MGICASLPRNADAANRPGSDKTGAAGSVPASPSSLPQPGAAAAAFDRDVARAAAAIAAASASAEMNNTLVSNSSQQPLPQRYNPLPLPSSLPQLFSPHPPSVDLRTSQDMPTPRNTLLTALGAQSSAPRLKLTALPPVVSPSKNNNNNNNSSISRGNNSTVAALLASLQSSCMPIEFGPIVSSFEDSSDEEENAGAGATTAGAAGPSSFYYEFLLRHGDVNATAKSGAGHTPSARELLQQRQANTAGRGGTAAAASHSKSISSGGGAALLPNSPGRPTQNNNAQGEGRAGPGPVDPAMFIPALNTFSREKAATHFFIDDDGEVRRLYRTTGWHRLKPERAGSFASSSSSVESKASSPPPLQGLVRHPSYDGLIFSSKHLHRVWTNETNNTATPHNPNTSSSSNSSSKGNVKLHAVEQARKPSKGTTGSSSSSTNKGGKSSNSSGGERKRAEPAAPPARRTRSDITEIRGRNGGGDRFSYRRGIGVLASPHNNGSSSGTISAFQQMDKAFPRSPILLKSGPLSRRGSRSSLKYEITDDDEGYADGNNASWSQGRLEGSTATRPPREEGDEDGGEDDGRRHAYNGEEDEQDTLSLKRKPSLSPKQKPRVRFTNGTEYFPGRTSTAKMRVLTHTSELQERESWRMNDETSDSDTVVTEEDARSSDSNSSNSSGEGEGQSGGNGRGAAATAAVVGVAGAPSRRAGSEKGAKGSYQLKNVHAGLRRSPGEAGK